jgi:hypothetical protein
VPSGDWLPAAKHAVVVINDNKIVRNIFAGLLVPAPMPSFIGIRRLKST